MIDTTAIREFCRQTGFRFMADGEVGFGRKCVGIMNPKTDCYIAYSHGSDRHTVADQKRPDHAYHKGDYLAVLVEYNTKPLDLDYDRAIQELEGWILAILTAGYSIKEYEEKDSITAFLQDGPVTQKMIVNEVS